MVKKIIIGCLLCYILTLGTVVLAATVLNSNLIKYDNSNSNLSATDVQTALDQIHTKAKDIRNYNNVVSAYTYNASTCVTGEESTCVKTSCYKSTSADKCKAGDIIKYKVNDTDIVTFHVMYDNGTTMTIQAQKNTINSTMWISPGDYATENTDGTSCRFDSCNDEGPMTVLLALERATQGWTNVNEINYTIGTTSLSSKGAYTGCTAYNSCTTNGYTLSSRTAKARMITVQEAVNLGCTTTNKSCPNWMNNYLYNSTSYGGTVSDSTTDLETGESNYGYWTMNVNPSYTYSAWGVGYYGRVGYNSSTYSTYYGARAVVEINKI